MLSMARSVTPFREWPADVDGLKRHVSSHVLLKRNPAPLMGQPSAFASATRLDSWSDRSALGIPCFAKIDSRDWITSVTFLLLSGSIMMYRLKRSTHIIAPIFIIPFPRVLVPECGASFMSGIISIWNMPPAMS